MNNNKDLPEFGVFIIESMEIIDENNGQLDGMVLKSILDICHIPNTYYYIRTKQEFENLINEFENSNYGFLHLSCHGSAEGIKTTYDNITFEELELLIGDRIYQRRLFLSACNIAQFELAKHFIPKYHCYSIIGSPDRIYCDKAAVFWSTFYHLMYERNQNEMPQVDLIPQLIRLTEIFNIKLNYFSIINNQNPKSVNHLREMHFESGQKVFDSIKETDNRNIFRM